MEQIRTLKVSLEVCVLGLSLGLVIFFAGCSGGSDKPDADKPVACSTLDCRSTKFNLETAKFNLVTANLDGSDLVVIAKDSYREMTHPRITFDRKWIAYVRHNQLNTYGCAEVKGENYNYTNTEIHATNMNGSVLVALTTPNTLRVSTNPYWIDNTYNFTFLDGAAGSTTLPDKIQIKRGYRDTDMVVTSPVSAVPVASSIFVLDPQQLGGKVVFPGLYDNAGILRASIFTIDASGVLDAKTLATVYKGSPASAVVATQANENDPKFSPNGSKIAFMRKINTGIAVNDHGFHVFVTSALLTNNATLGTEIDVSDKYLGANTQSLFYNDGVPEWIDEDTLVFFTLNFTDLSAPPNYGLEQKLFTMKTDGTKRTEIPLPAGYHYSDPIPYKDALGKTRILFGANKSAAPCTP